MKLFYLSQFNRVASRYEFIKSRFTNLVLSRISYNFCNKI